MEPMLRRSALALCLLPVSGVAQGQPGQNHPDSPAPDAERDVTLPNGKSQRDEILKAEHE